MAIGFEVNQLSKFNVPEYDEDKIKEILTSDQRFKLAVYRDRISNFNEAINMFDELKEKPTEGVTPELIGQGAVCALFCKNIEDIDFKTMTIEKIQNEYERILGKLEKLTHMDKESEEFRVAAIKGIIKMVVFTIEERKSIDDLAYFSSCKLLQDKLEDEITIPYKAFRRLTNAVNKKITKNLTDFWVEVLKVDFKDTSNEKLDIYNASTDPSLRKDGSENFINKYNIISRYLLKTLIDLTKKENKDTIDQLKASIHEKISDDKKILSSLNYVIESSQLEKKPSKLYITISKDTDPREQAVKIAEIIKEHTENKYKV